MPYGIPKDKGGDSKKNDKKMEDCVAKVMGTGKDKESAIRICKSSLYGQSEPMDIKMNQDGTIELEESVQPSISIDDDGTIQILQNGVDHD